MIQRRPNAQASSCIDTRFPPIPRRSGVLGIKRIAWRACTPPVIAPKQDLVALTGGYRWIPVMQVGANVYCDSQLIIRTLDRMFPEPPLHACELA
jgi:hypothetical protein